jgi:hypothetical protein
LPLLSFLGTLGHLVLFQAILGTSVTGYIQYKLCTVGIEANPNVFKPQFYKKKTMLNFNHFGTGPLNCNLSAFLVQH